jgi:hypothetical protein
MCTDVEELKVILSPDRQSRLVILKVRDGVFSYEIEHWDADEQSWIPEGGHISYCATEEIACREDIASVS